MRKNAPTPLDNWANRRAFLTATGIASATAILGMVPAGRLAYAAALTKSQRDQLTPDDIVALMKKGNERFRLGQESPHDYLAQQKASAKGQYPAAVILGSSTPVRRPRRSSIWASATASTRVWPATSPTTTSSGAWSSPARSPGRRSCL